VYFLNTQRARQIAASSDMANVTHDGEQVYIQHVDEDAETARIYPLKNPEREKTVPLSSLEEHESE
jgi:small acid-soluble spore protein H (minor)